MGTPATIPPHQGQFTEASDKSCPSAIEKRKAMSPYLYLLVAQQPFFKGLNAQQLQMLTDSAIEMQFESGQSIFQEGSPANRFYLILEGKVALESKLKEGGMIAIQTLGPGDELGWSWLLRSSNLLLSARALEPTRTIFFYGTHLRQQCEQDHELGYQLMQRIAEVATQCVRAMHDRFMECTHSMQTDDRLQNGALDVKQI
jgi:CRP-like cAMP-binding protein